MAIITIIIIATIAVFTGLFPAYFCSCPQSFQALDNPLKGACLLDRAADKRSRLGLAFRLRERERDRESHSKAKKA